MGDVYQHPVFFECPGLLGEQKKKIETYFRVQRKSGGGDCGALERLTNQTYRVAFKDPKAQRAVLRKCEHVVDGLVFHVRGSPEALPSSASQGRTDPLQSPQCIPASTPSPSGEEYELQPDSHLLHYLKECPKAVKELEEALTSVACSAQLYPEEGRALVSRLAQAGAAVRNWKAEVDNIFDGYMCHYEVDPHKAKALRQANSSGQTTDEVKVYSEVGMAVVVGECSQVNAMLMAVEDLHAKRRSSYSKKKKKNRRMGEAKLRLLWKDMQCSLQQDFPEVTVAQGAAGQLVLEGSAEEILKAEDFISEQENAVLERTVSDMSLHFLAFLRKAYGGPGELGDFLGVGDKVEIELRDTEVRFLSLSTDDLDETVKALQGEIKEVKIDVPNCCSVPSDLREEITSRTNEMNHGQYKAQVEFGPDSTVCLLGHTKEVEELRESIIQFLDESSIVHLPFIELAHKLPELLQMHDFDYSGVTFHPKTSSSGFTVALKGPSSKVAEVKSWLDLYLDFLLEDNTDQLGIERYSKSPTGNDNLPNVARDLVSRCEWPLQERISGNAATRDGDPEDGVQVEIIQGTMETQKVDALASPMIGQHPLSTGVGNTLSKIVGSQLIAKFRKETREETVPGDAVLVEDLPRTLPFNAVFFLELIPWDEETDGTAVQVLKLAINNFLTSCEHRGFRSVALPVLGSGIALRFPSNVVASVLLEGVQAFEQNRACRTPFLLRVVIHPNDDESSKAFRSVQEAFQIKRLTKDVHQPDQVSTPRRIVLLGKTGSGKSNLANTIFGEQLFKTDPSANSGTTECQAETKSVNGRSITLIDTPGVFDTKRPEEELKSEIVNCIIDCAPGPHAFLIVLKVDRFTAQEKAVITKICQYFSEDVLKYAVIIFTHGDQLEEGKTIEDFVHDNDLLRDLVEKCGGRCHVVDNKHWKNNQQEEYRNNQVQVEELLNTIDRMVEANNGDYYTNQVFQVVEERIQSEEQVIKQNMSGNMTPEEIRKQAKKEVSNRLLIQLAGTATGVVLGAFLGVVGMVGIVITALNNVTGLLKFMEKLRALGSAVAVTAGGGAAAVTAGGGAAAVTAGGGAAAVTAGGGGAAAVTAGGGAAAVTAVGGAAAVTAGEGAAAVTAGGGAAAAGGGLAVSGVVLGVTTAVFATTGGVIGGVIGHEAAKDAETVGEAVEMAKNAILNKVNATLKRH